MSKPGKRSGSRITTPLPRRSDWGSYTIEDIDREYRGRFVTLFNYKVRDYQYAEDLAQETMIRIWKYWERRDVSRLSGMIGTIANRVLSDHYRGKFDKNRNDTDFMDDFFEFESHDEGIKDPLRELIVERAADKVDEFTEILKDKDREIFLDFYLRDMDITDIMEKYNKKRSDVYVNLHRIRALLVECFEAYDLIPDERWTFGLEGENYHGE